MENYRQALATLRSSIQEEIEFRRKIVDEIYKINLKIESVLPEIVAKNTQLNKKRDEHTENLKQLTSVTYDELKDTIGASVFQIEEQIATLEAELHSAISFHDTLKAEKAEMQTHLQQLDNNKKQAEKQLRIASNALIEHLNLKNRPGKIQTSMNFRDVLINCTRSEKDFRCMNLPDCFEVENKTYQNVADLLNISICIIELVGFRDHITDGTTIQIKAIVDPIKKISSNSFEQVYLCIDDMGNFLVWK